MRHKLLLDMCQFAHVVLQEKEILYIIVTPEFLRQACYCQGLFIAAMF